MSEQDNRWHLDKRLNVGHLITTLTLAGAMITWAMSIDSRIAEHEIKISNNSEKINHAEDRNIRSLEQIDSKMNRMNDKLDRLIERN